MQTVVTVDNYDKNRIYEFSSTEFNIPTLFALYAANRGGRDNSKHVNSIAKGIIKEGGLANFPPILVDVNTNQIIDGNTRYQAIINVLEEGKFTDPLVLRVIFKSVAPDEFDAEVRRYNAGQKKWNMLEYIYNYSMRGFDSFTKLIDFCLSEEELHTATNKINPRYAAAALNISTKYLMSEELSISDEDIKVGHSIMAEASIIKRAITDDDHELGGGGGWLEPFLRAWYDFRVHLGHLPFNKYAKMVAKAAKHQKRDCRVPYGSNKASDWYGFFSNVYMRNMK